MTEVLERQSPAAGAKVEPAPAAGEGARVPVCFVVDDDASIRHFLSLILHGAGIDTEEYGDGKSFAQAAAKRSPDLVFLNISLESGEAIEAILALAKRGYFGFVQLMSSRGSAVLEHVKSVGEQHKLQMLPVLKNRSRPPPSRGSCSSSLGHPAPMAARIGSTKRSARGGSNSGISRRSTCGKSSLPEPRRSRAPATPNTASCRRARSCRGRPNPS